MFYEVEFIKQLALINEHDINKQLAELITNIDCKNKNYKH